MALSTFRNQLSSRLFSNYSYVRSMSISPSVEAETISGLKFIYLEKVVPVLIGVFNYSNIHQVPKVDKIVVKFGIQDSDQKAAMNDLELITGQKPVKRRAKIAISNFKKIKEKQILGLAVTLRGNGMYSFFDRLVNGALPMVWDFGGVTSNSFDGKGNYNLRFREQSVFPEISHDVLGKSRGMDVCISTTAATDEEARKLLALMGMPFRDGAALARANAMQKKLKSLY